MSGLSRRMAAMVRIIVLSQCMVGRVTRIAAQHAKGKLTERERLEVLLKGDGFGSGELTTASTALQNS